MSVYYVCMYGTQISLLQVLSRQALPPPSWKGGKEPTASCTAISACPRAGSLGWVPVLLWGWCCQLRKVVLPVPTPELLWVQPTPLPKMMVRQIPAPSCALGWMG